MAGTEAIKSSNQWNSSPAESAHGTPPLHMAAPDPGRFLTQLPGGFIKSTSDAVFLGNVVQVSGVVIKP